MGKFILPVATHVHCTSIFKLLLDSIGGYVYLFITIIYIQIAMFKIIFDPYFIIT